MGIKMIFVILEEVKNFLFKEKDHQLYLKKMVTVIKSIENKLIKSNYKKKKKVTKNLTKIFIRPNKNAKCKKAQSSQLSFKKKFFLSLIEPKLRTRYENMNKNYFKNLTKNKILPLSFFLKDFEISPSNIFFSGNEENFHLKKFRKTIEFYFKYFNNNLYRINLFSIHHFKKKGSRLFLFQINKESIWLKILKKLEYCKKNHRNLTYSILKFFYFLQKTIKTKSKLFLINDIFIDKENTLKKNYCLFKFLKKVEPNSYQTSPFNYPPKKFYGDVDKKPQKIQLTLFEVDYFLSNYNKFKINLKNSCLKPEDFEIFLIKNSINSLLDLSLFIQKLRVYPHKLRKRMEFCFIIKLFLERIIQVSSKLSLSKGEQDHLYLMSKNFLIWSRYCRIYQKNYLLTFLNRITQTCLSLVFDSNLKKKKIVFHNFRIFFIIIQNIKMKITRFSNFHSENYFFCKSCMIKYSLSFLKNFFLYKGTTFRSIFFFEQISTTFIILPILKKLIFCIVFNLMNENVKRIFNLKLIVETFKYLNLFFSRTSKEKFSLFYQENIIFLSVIKNFKIFQEKFLFFVYLITRKFFKKFSALRILLYNSEMSENRKNFQIVFANCWPFLLNYLFEFSSLNTFFKEDLIIEKIKINKEILMIIGPNRDFSVFSINHFNNFKREDKVETNFYLWQNRVISMGHFSRSKKLSFFKYCLFKNNEFKIIFEWNGKVSDSSNPSLNSIDKKLSRSFLFFSLKINEEYNDSSMFIVKKFFFKQNIHVSETFYKKSNNLIENSFKNTKNYFKDNKILGQNKNMNSEIFFVFDSFLVRDCVGPLISSKNIKEFIKLTDNGKSSKNFPLDFLHDILISTIIYRKPFTSLFSKLCSFSLLQYCTKKTELNRGFRKISIHILKIIKKSIREHFFFVKKKSTSLFKISRGNFFQLTLITKITWNIKKSKRISKKILNNFGKNLLDKRTDLISDFSEYSLVDNLSGKFRSM